MSDHSSYTITEGRQIVRHVSLNTVYEECLDNGRWIGLYWSSGGQIQRENVTASMPEPLDPARVPLDSFRLEIDGQSLHNHWDWLGWTQRDGHRPGTLESVTRLRHQVRNVEIAVVTRLDGSGALVRYLEVMNTGVVPAALSLLSPMSGLLWHNEMQWGKLPFDMSGKSPFTVGYYRSDSWGEEGNFVWQPLSAEIFRVEKTWGCQYGAPDFIIKNEVTGEMFHLALAWSGNYFAEFSFNRKHNTLSFQLGPFGKAPLRVLEPGETIKSPEVHILPTFRGLDRSVGEWYRHFRNSVAPARPEGKRMFTMAARVVEEPGDWILKEIEIAAAMGVEAFMVDAGWYGDTFRPWPELRGDWQEGPFLPGSGIETIRKAVHDKGMLFGMWMEPEVMGVKSRVFAEHPEWALRHDGSLKVQGLLDFSNSGAVEFVEESILHVLRDYQPDFYKTDYNDRFPEGGQNLCEGFLQGEEWRHYEALYGIYDRALKENPGIVMENCAGGGGRLDLGMMSRFHYGCESDWSVMPFSIRAINALTLFLPPESLCYYHNHIGKAHQTAEMDTHLRVTLFALPIYVGFGAQNAMQDTEYFERTRYHIALHKGFCRPVMEGSPTVYHHTPDIGLLEPANWCVLEYAMQDRTRGYAGVFKIGDQPHDPVYVLRLKGVDPSCTYQVRLENDGFVYEANGAELMRNGLRIELDHAGMSELILYEALN